MATPPPPAVVAEMRIALALAASASAARWPFTSDPLDFWAGGGKLFVSSGAASARLHLKGVSWFGFETSTACEYLHGECRNAVETRLCPPPCKDWCKAPWHTGEFPTCGFAGCAGCSECLN